MKKLTTIITAVALVGGSSYAIAQNQLETTLDLMVRGMMDEGASVSYDERIIGDDLSVEYTNLVIVAPEGDIAFEFDWLKGTPSASDPEYVTFTVSDTISVSGIAEDIEFGFDIQSSGLKLTTNGLLREAMSTNDVTVTFDTETFFVTGGEPDSEFLRNIYVDMGAIDFDLLVSEADDFLEGSFNADKFDIAYDFTAEGQTQVVEQSTDSISVSFKADTLEEKDDFTEFVDGSKSAAINMASGPSEFITSIDADGVQMNMEGTSGAGKALLRMEGGIFTYDINAEGFDMVVTPGEGMPFPPVEVGMGEMGMRVALPASAVEAPSEVLVDILFADLVVGEGLWSIIDPEQTISREPAQIDIDLEALVKFNPMAAISDEGPVAFATVHNLDINRILLAIAGASIQANGATTIDNSGELPMPLGTVNIEFNGVSTLLDQLVTLGLLDQMQVGMALGMIMAFGEPGNEVDQFLSEITFTEEGVLANGRPIQ